MSNLYHSDRDEDESLITVSATDFRSKFKETADRFHREKTDGILRRTNAELRKTLSEFAQSSGVQPKSSVTIRAVSGETEAMLQEAATHLRKYGYDVRVDEVDDCNDGPHYTSGYKYLEITVPNLS
jgi:hypothetical protein